MAGQSVPMETREQVFRQLDKTLDQVNNLVGVYIALKNPQGFVQDLGATERINFAGRLRMLSQRVAANSCLYTASIEQDATIAALSYAYVEFEKIMNALEFGDADLRIFGTETRRKTIAGIHDLRTTWAPIKASIDEMVVNGASASAQTVFDDTIFDLLERARSLMTEVSGQYSDPSAMNQSDAIAINIAGRQRTLTQKMLKEACLIWVGGSAQTEDIRLELQSTMEMFEVSLNALQTGLPSAGISPPPTAKISDQLAIVAKDWDEVKPILDGILTGEQIDETQKAQAYYLLNNTLKDMNVAVGLYSANAKSQL